MTRSPRFWLVLGVLAFVLNFWLVARADAFWGYWQMFDPWGWMK